MASANASDRGPSERRSPSILEAFLPFLVMAVLLGVGYGIYRLRIEAPRRYPPC